MKHHRQMSSLAAVLMMVGSASLFAACSPSTQTGASNQSNQAEVSETTTTSQTTTSPSPASSAASHHHGADHMSAMDLGPADENYDLRFIDGMIPHHQGAIVMAKDALQQSKRPEIKTLAQNIITAQNREENELMRKWRKAWYPNAGETPMAYNSQMGKMMPMTDQQRKEMAMEVNLGEGDDQYDLRFINAMIPHHEGAIAMAKDALNKSKRPEIKQLANEIIASQQAEIDQMKQWRKAWYKQ